MTEKSDADLVDETFQEILKKYEKISEKIRIEDDLEIIFERRLPKICLDENTEDLIYIMNEILSKEIKDDLSIQKLHTLTYCAAKTIVEVCKKREKDVYDQLEIPKKFPKNDENGQKKLFKISPLLFKRLLFNGPTEVEEENAPSLAELEEHWTNRWKIKERNVEPTKKDEEYLKMENERIGENTAMDPCLINMKDFRRAMNQKNWSPPGIDGIQIFWYKKFRPLHKLWLKKINAILNGTEEMPEFFTSGFTELVPKDEHTYNPSKYRPITHLPIIYKIITRCIYQKIFAHYEKFGILADEQCGGRKGCHGVKKTLIMDAILLNKEPVYGCYVDFQKAFDSVPHDWILELLKVYKIDENIVNFLETVMNKWKTRIFLSPKMFTNVIKLERGVFYGDPVSVILFWTAINPLSFALNKIQEKSITHLLYMDDLKLYASNKEDLDKLYKEVQDFCAAINMKENPKKTKKFCIPSEKDVKYVDKVYLGYIQTPTINSDTTVYHKVRKFDKKCKELENTHISEKEKQMLKTRFLISSIYGSFGILTWRQFKRELLKVEMKGKVVEFLQDRNDIPDIYLKLFTDMCKLRRQFYKEAESSDLMKIIVKSDNRVTPLNLSERDEKQYLKTLIADMKQRPKRKRKISN